jgi:hypothetical protein
MNITMRRDIVIPNEVKFSRSKKFGPRKFLEIFQVGTTETMSEIGCSVTPSSEILSLYCISLKNYARTRTRNLLKTKHLTNFQFGTKLEELAPSPLTF